METLRSEALRKITFRIRRCDPGRDLGPRWATYRLAVPEGLTVLEALHFIKEEQDATLAWRSSCRMGICGSCGMYVNGLPRLACQTQVLHLKSDVVEIAPLPNHPVVKDLVPDLMPMFEKHAAIRPYLIADAGDRLDGEYLQTPEQREAFGQFTICIKCGLCVSACPTAATDPHFLGPMALAQAYRYAVDNRDDGLSARLETLGRLHGLFQCHLAGACTDACSKGVDPALGIQLLKRELSLAALGLRRPKQPTPVAPLASEHVPHEQIPNPPPRTVNLEKVNAD